MEGSCVTACPLPENRFHAVIALPESMSTKTDRIWEAKRLASAAIYREPDWIPR